MPACSRLRSITAPRISAPQEFQVLVEKARRRIECGNVRVGFFVRKNLRRVPTQTLNTPRGFIVVSTPEATAFDLVGYHHRAGGLSNVAHGSLGACGEDRSRATRDGGARRPRFRGRKGWATFWSWPEPVARRGRFSNTCARTCTNPSCSVRARRRGTSSRQDAWKLFVNAEVEIDL